MEENIKKDYIKVGEQIVYLPDTDDNDWFSFCVDGIEVNTGHSIRILISDMRDYIKLWVKELIFWILVVLLVIIMIKTLNLSITFNYCN